VSSVKISDLPDMNDSSVELSVQLETGTGERGLSKLFSTFLKLMRRENGKKVKEG